MSGREEASLSVHIFRFSVVIICFTLPLFAKISPKVQQQVKPYLLPQGHPAQNALEQIFREPGVLLNEKTMRKAGFLDVKPRKFTRLVVTRHPMLPGYVIKTYLDNQRYYKRKPEYDHWISRIEGIKKIERIIDRKGWNHLFKVPSKYVYQVPAGKKTKNYLTKHFVLVETDMELVPENQNLNTWKSHSLSHEQLNALFVILKKVGLRDCATPDNIPFSKDGRIAFIDTQTHGVKVPFSDLSPYLSRTNRHYWHELTQN